MILARQLPKRNQKWNGHEHVYAPLRGNSCVNVDVCTEHDSITGCPATAVFVAFAVVLMASVIGCCIGCGAAMDAVVSTLCNVGYGAAMDARGHLHT